MTRRVRAKGRKAMLWVVLAAMTGSRARRGVAAASGRRRGAAGASDAASLGELGEIERDVARGLLPAEEAAGRASRRRGG